MRFGESATYDNEVLVLVVLRYKALVVKDVSLCIRSIDCIIRITKWGCKEYLVQPRENAPTIVSLSILRV